MAFPAIVTVGTGETAVDTTSHVVTMPTGINVGDLLVVAFSVDGNPTCTASAGWTKLGQDTYTTDPTGAIFWKIATGSDTLTVTTNNQQATWVSFRIVGGSTITGTSFKGNTANSDPAAHTAPGTGDNLWIATWSGDGIVIPSAPPSGFTPTPSKTGTGLNTASTYCAYKVEASVTVNPGVFTNTSRGWVCWTLVVPPTPPPPCPDAPLVGQWWPR